MVEIIRLSKCYKNKIILNSLNYKFPSKGMILIYGSSGCGKTTLLNLLEGLDKDYQGKILFENKDIKIRKNNEVLQRNSYLIFQDCNFIDFLTVKENVNLIINKKEQKYPISKLKYLLDRYGMGHILNNDVKSLSGGEKQILSICLAYVSNAKIVFCDEPTGSMDESSEKISMQLLKEISLNKLVLVVSHNVNLFKKYSSTSLELKGGDLIC